MRLLSTICIVAFSLPLISVACGGGSGGDEEPYDTFQDCFDDHHDVEAFTVEDSIKICCIDHPIGGQDANVVCGETAVDCEDFVDANLDSTSATVDEIANACTDYIIDRSM